MSGTCRLYTTPVIGSRKCCVTKTNFGGSCGGPVGATSPPASCSPGCFASSALLISLVSSFFSSVFGFSSVAAGSAEGAASVLVASAGTVVVSAAAAGASVRLSLGASSAWATVSTGWPTRTDTEIGSRLWQSRLTSIRG
ncbi:hypothetical protein TYRP_000021 [Tyrophagus putrescentiae]|nr:hypothetical protein TYRP_000021 [Tyrophagus putrescentiae]